MVYRKYTLAAVVLIFALSAALFTCGGSGGSGYPAPNTAGSTVQVVSCATVTADMTVSIAASAFNPAGVSIPVNGVVKWTNNDSIDHTVTNSSAPSGGTFDSTLVPAASTCLRFTVMGSYQYFCRFHPMTGSVTVN